MKIYRCTGFGKPNTTTTDHPPASAQVAKGY